MHYHTIIIGAGAAGLFAAQALGSGKKKILLLERNKIPGKKLLLAGAGQCNFTHGGSIEAFFERYGDNGKFLKKAFSVLTNEDVKKFFEKQGVPSEERENGKIFPKSKKGQDIIDSLVKTCKKRGAEMKYEAYVRQVTECDTLFTVELQSGERYFCENIVIATGGMSFPQTGSDGWGYRAAEQFGHTIITPRPSLTSIVTQEDTFKELSGISFEEIEMSLWRENKKIRDCKGSILFTHKGLSGPVILDHTRWMQEKDQLEINFLYPTPYEAVDAYFIEQLQKRGKEEVLTFLKTLPVPKSFAEVICKYAGVEASLHCAKLSKVQRESLVEAFVKHKVTISEVGGLKSAMATAGGVKLKEINPTTMESRKQKGLYFIGEVVDVDGNTGGYNIQAAFSMGFLCAKHIIEKK